MRGAVCGCENAICAKANDLCFAPRALSAYASAHRFISLLFCKWAQFTFAHSIRDANGRAPFFVPLEAARQKFLRRQIKLVNFHFPRVCSHAMDGFDLHAYPVIFMCESQ